MLVKCGILASPEGRGLRIIPAQRSLLDLGDYEEASTAAARGAVRVRRGRRLR